jgi:hypothetical protein
LFTDFNSYDVCSCLVDNLISTTDLLLCYVTIYTLIMRHVVINMDGICYFSKPEKSSIFCSTSVACGVRVRSNLFTYHATKIVVRVVRHDIDSKCN